MAIGKGGAVNLAAAGAYLQEMRSLRKLSRQNVAELIGISDDRILQFETARGTMNGPALLRYIYAVGASADELYSLLEGDETTVDQARGLARRRVQQEAERQTVGDKTAELFEIALRRTDGDAAAARALLLEAIEKTMTK